MTNVLTKISEYTAALMGDVYDSVAMLTQIAVFGALKYGLHISVPPPKHRPDITSPIDLSRMLRVCVSDDEKAPAIYIFLHHSEIEDIIYTLETVDEDDVEYDDSDDEEGYDPDMSEDSAEEIDEPDDPDDSDDEEDDPLTFKIEDVGDVWEVEGILVDFTFPDKEADFDHIGYQKLINALVSLGYTLNNSVFDKDQVPEEHRWKLPYSRVSMMFPIQDSEKDVPSLDWVLRTYVENKPGLKTNPLCKYRDRRR